MGSMKGQPTVPTGPTNFSPVKLPQAADMEKIRMQVKSAKLNDVLAKLALGKKR